MIIQFPPTKEQREKKATVSDKQVREAQDALFMYLINRIDELEAKIPPSKKGK
ncbi:MAG: hypothetical protein IKN27_06755 [Selenomonadaceae bacterium]|nr:hypothetical protein [Selenomonadaceae bacterium]